MSLLKVRGLTKKFGGLVAVGDVSFDLARGEFLALIGPNGAGKTTCFNMIGGYLRPDRGSVRLEGRDIVGLPPRRIWRMGVGRTFQITETFRSMTVRENVQMALISHHRRSFDMVSAAAKLYVAEADALLADTGMEAHAGRPCSELAYGDLKRLELAIAMAHKPRLLLMDEPTAGMAPSERVALMALTAGIVAREGLSVIFTEHDMDVVFAHAHRILVLNRGRLIAEGTGDEIRADATVREVYLGGGAIRARDEADHA
ncbi:ABC transporter ATP-binding protein [Maritimibacter sp. 55A14]|uniref:ABC transporter ATP-binding protein n=1 Tax=Maritimibacter sp. 55A14 TaxID=2174844 RepID=UPI000D61CD7B|nr:ABC transporter ATP-binding protein [Maritimibacter sp. 55A14]PWE30508.1 ABC transporter ATP-binding protein [Maritimibacter sp. 55A14]